jgi:Leucine-rich repeat (LRR) protein
MSLTKLLAICKENGSPSAVQAVVSLDLRSQLFTEINECLEEFSEVQTLFLGHNHIERICHLDRLQQLRVLCECMRACAISSIPTVLCTQPPPPLPNTP